MNINLANWQGQFSDFHFFICILKASMQWAFFYLSGKMFHILGPRNEILSDLWYTVLIVNTEFFWGRSVAHSFAWKVLWQLKEIGHFFLYISVAKIWRFWLWTETESSFSNSVSDDDCLSECIIHKQRSYSLFILPLLTRLRHIHTRGQ